ncbi:unnamed protein product (macronuclear) [Paramecium tetraurelia]|uniref:PARG catalytic Macro domain-containing protein n=1 Tax=Paramecium tetraurelia TaxID=5888 RepID=A0EAE4_PARTE|nr:uncharacterized protein GSPATT00024993001 [Paramecium tetraurelia]CAK92261.1 unnamed protein product [Paramecium tetraurelia]|eukprot:XP_001459658.1 hypothetical protein (macronuclear) [Paramecium tetraurelia strain d4-2]
MQLRIKANRKEYFDFSNISNVRNNHLYVGQTVYDYHLKLISSINEFIAKQKQTNIKDNGKKYNYQEERSSLQNQQQQGNNQEKPFIEKKIEFTRKEVFVLLLMMYSNILEKDNQNMKGFYQINMELIKQSQSKQSQEKLKCIHSYFINFYHRILKQNDGVSNDYNLNSNEIQRQIQNLEKEIQEEQHQHDKKIEQLNQRIQMILRQFINNNPKEYSEMQQQDELVTFIRRTEFRNYKEIYNDQQCPLSQFQKNKGRCEDYENSILVNFADKNVGGLSLDSLNIAQEEVLMLTHPEALISMLFMEPMNDNEAILIKNLIKFNDYDGYGQTFRQKEEDYFKWNSNSSLKQNNEFSQRQQDLNKQNDAHNKKIITNHILCMDAIFYSNWQIQFDEKYINRELVKSYIAFSLALDHTDSKYVSTGKWGCGIFNGDIQLKFLIQLLAFSKAYQDSQYRNEDFKNKTEKYISFSSFHDGKFESLIQQYYQAQTEQKQNITKINYVIETLKGQFKQQISKGFNK